MMGEADKLKTQKGKNERYKKYLEILRKYEDEYEFTGKSEYDSIVNELSKEIEMCNIGQITGKRPPSGG